MGGGGGDIFPWKRVIFQLLGEPQSRSGRFGYVKIFLPLLEFEPRTIQPVAYSLYGLSYTAQIVHGNDQCGHMSSGKNQVLVNEENAQTQQELLV